MTPTMLVNIAGQTEQREVACIGIDDHGMRREEPVLRTGELIIWTVGSPVPICVEAGGFRAAEPTGEALGSTVDQFV